MVLRMPVCAMITAQNIAGGNAPSLVDRTFLAPEPWQENNKSQDWVLALVFLLRSDLRTLLSYPSVGIQRLLRQR